MMSGMGGGRFRDWNVDCKVYVGNLPDNAIKADVENAFSKYGHVRNVWVARNPPGFAFVEYEDARDAEDAVRGLDGTRICGSRVRVEMSHGRSRRGGGRDGGRDGRRSGGRDGGRDSRDDHDRRGGGYSGRRGGGRSRSRSKSRSRSRSRSPKRHSSRYSRSRSYSRSHSRDTRSRSRDSRSVSPVVANNSRTAAGGGSGGGRPMTPPSRSPIASK